MHIVHKKTKKLRRMNASKTSFNTKFATKNLGKNLLFSLFCVKKNTHTHNLQR